MSNMQTNCIRNSSLQNEKMLDTKEDVLKNFSNQTVDDIYI